MTGGAFRSFGFAGRGDLLGIHVLAVRETLYPELVHLGWKTYAGALSVDRRFVTNNTHLAGGVCKILRVTFNACGVTREYRGDIVVRTLMTETAILGLRLMLWSTVIERRCALDDRRFLDIERRRRGCRLWSRLLRLGGFIGGRLLGALAS